MAAELSSSSAAAAPGGAAKAASPESYIGSLISLTSKSEIRYEGVLYTINTDESSIGLRNVRSFGTEGRKKDGPQIPASDKVYEYILFRGSDIKDLQVKSSPPAQATAVHNDPAIIQSQFARPPSTSSAVPSNATGMLPDLNSQAAQSGIQRPTIQGNLPVYQSPAGGLVSWSSSIAPPSASGPGLPLAPSANISGMSMPPTGASGQVMAPTYWQGYYTPPGSFPPMQQHSMFRPPHGLSVPPFVQQSMQYPSLSMSLPSGLQTLPELPSFLQPGNANLSSATITPASSAPSKSVPATEASTNLLPNRPSSNVAVPPVSSIPFVTPSTSIVEPSMPSTKSMISSDGSIPVIPVSFQSTQSGSIVPSNPIEVETSLPSVTVDHQKISAVISTPHSLETGNKELDAKPIESENKLLLPEARSIASSETNEPPLPAPRPTMHKPLRETSYNRYVNNSRGQGRGRGRGRGNGYAGPITGFTEEFDFNAMNEKFNKDEVWGHLGKSKAQTSEDDLIDFENEDNLQYGEDDYKIAENKPVYVKDDFFDSLSCSTTGGGSRNGRTKFSEQMKLDTETFGNFPRYRGGGGGRGPRGGSYRGRGSYYGSRGYGYNSRGRGQSYSDNSF